MSGSRPTTGHDQPAPTAVPGAQPLATLPAAEFPKQDLCSALTALPLVIWRQTQGGPRQVWRCGQGGISGTPGFCTESLEAWLERVHPADRAGVLERDGRGGEWEAEWRLKRGDGTWAWVLERAAPCEDPSGGPAGQAGVCFEIQARKLHEQELIHRAEHDPLTGLCNRQIFVEHLRRALARNVRNERHLALIFVDLDGFKNINDAHGHALGDELLIAVSRLLGRLVRPQDVVTRLGGDEFVILIDEVQAPEEGLAIADRLVSEFAKPFETSEGLVSISASCGLSLAAPGGHLSANELLERADEAMYLAKRRGKARTALYDAEFASEAARRRRLEGDLEAAMLGGQLVPYYQPIVELAQLPQGGEPGGGQRLAPLVGFELLMRWQHPELGLLCAMDFLEAVVRGRRLAELERRLLPLALSQFAAWLRRSPRALKLHINLSPQQLRSEGFIPELEALLKTSGVSAESLAFEIPESSLTRDYAAASDVMRSLANLGASLWVDEFGSGHTSLSRLVHLPLTGLKVHRSFAVRLENDPGARSALLASAALARALNLSAVVQGVESACCAEQVTSLGCRLAQGFHFAEALPAAAAAQWLD
jgi:diguanylate cyclase (GGDEF)-like protein